MTSAPPPNQPAEPSPDDTVVRMRPPAFEEEPAPTSTPPSAPATRPAHSRRGRVVAGIVLGVLVVGLGVAYGVGYAAAGDRLPRNASIAGVAVGGLEAGAAQQRLSEELKDRATAAIPVTVGGTTATVDPAAAGLSVDYAASVERAGGGKSLDPRQIWRVLTGGAETDPVVVADRKRLDAAVAALAGRVDREPSDAALRYDDVAVAITRSADGIVVDQPGAAEAIEDAYLAAGDPVALPADLTPAAITTAEAEQVAADVAKPAVAASIKVAAGSAGSFTISRSMIAEAVSFTPADGTLVLKLDPTKLRKAAADEVAEVETTKPRDATVRIRNGKPEVVPAVNGTTISADALATAVEPVLTRSGAERRATVELTGARADFSTADAEKLGVTRITGEFTTYFPYAEYRNINIGRAAEKINNTLLKPGEVFSLNRVVGERTRANGFAEGYIIQNGRFRKELGGGVSQSATTTYNAMFFAGLKDIQHQPHTLYIDRYPAGREATVAWPSLDLKFQNDTRYGVVVQAFVQPSTPGTRGSITVRMWSTQTYDKVESSDLRRSDYTTGREIKDDEADCEPVEPVQGFLVTYARLFYNDGKLVKREPLSWRYAPTDRVTCT